MNRVNAAILVMLSVLLTVVLAFNTLIAEAQRKNHESYYQEIWCDSANGEAEVVLPDNTRCDCVTDKYSVEMDFADKWPEAIGQALHYSLLTGKRAGITLIVEETEDMKYWDRMNKVISEFNLPIDAWLMRADGKWRTGPE